VFLFLSFVILLLQNKMDTMERKRKIGHVESRLCEKLDVKKVVLSKTNEVLSKTNEVLTNEESRTESCDVNYRTSGNVLLDLFFTIVRGHEISDEKMNELWKANPTTLIQILKHARDVRKGKGEKKIVRYALLWLRHHKPKTYLLNLRDFTINLGYFKDLVQLASEIPLDHRKEMFGLELAIIGEALLYDKELVDTSNRMDEKQISISLAAKWAPSEGKHFDVLAKRLAKLMFPQSKTALKEYRLLLTKLRHHLNLVETLMCENKFDQIDFSKVPSKAHRLLRKAFVKHNPLRYEKYLEQVSLGKQKINTTATYPHELVQACMNRQHDKTTQLMWEDIVDKLRSNTLTSSSVAVVDVSASMNGTPMEVAIALGLMVSELTTLPFRDRVITFDTTPAWHVLNPKDSLADKVSHMLRAPWGGSTNLRGTFDLILDTAVGSKVSQEDMPQTLFIFSDMQFNQACGNQEKSQSTFQYAKQRFKEHGYQLPKIVFWNLRGDSKGVPIQSSTEEQTALVSGYSPTLFKLFTQGNFSPIEIMNDAIQSYSGFVDESEL